MNQTKTDVFSIITMAVMAALSLTQLVPSLQLAGIAVWIGLAGFFVSERLKGIPRKDSALRFRGMGKELRQKDIWPLILLLIIVQLAYVSIGTAVFGSSYLQYDVGRALEAVHAPHMVGLLIPILISSWGEEIAWRGFFLGQKTGSIPFAVWAVISSALFAIGHFSDGPFVLCIFGVSSNFVCSLILSQLFDKTRNCMVSTTAHILGNYAEWFLLLILLR